MLEYPHDDIVEALRAEFGYTEERARTLIEEVDTALHN